MTPSTGLRAGPSTGLRAGGAVGGTVATLRVPYRELFSERGDAAR